MQSAQPTRLNRSVHFPIEPITSVSRSPSTREYEVIDNYECHARRCRRCNDACHGRAFTSHDLCPEGRILSGRICLYLWGAGDGHIYSTAQGSARYTRVEVSRYFSEFRRLMTLKKARRRLRRRSSILYMREVTSRRELPPYVLVVRNRR
jgi:hypothetical protein